MYLLCTYPHSTKIRTAAATKTPAATAMAGANKKRILAKTKKMFLKVLSCIRVFVFESKRSQPNNEFGTSLARSLYLSTIHVL
jgi:hypothetical protein